MGLSRFIMELAIRGVPADRQDWANAMRAEFEVMQNGRLGWALGCLKTSLGWDLRANALYLLALPLCIMAIDQFASTPLFWWAAKHCSIHTHAYCAYTPYYTGGFEFLAPCLFFGFWRPDRIVTTAIVMTLCRLICTYLFFAIAMQTYSYVHIMNMPPVIGETVVLVGGLLGASAGALLRQGARRVKVRQP